MACRCPDRFLKTLPHVLFLQIRLQQTVLRLTCFFTNIYTKPFSYHLSHERLLRTSPNSIYITTSTPFSLTTYFILFHHQPSHWHKPTVTRDSTCTTWMHPPILRTHAFKTRISWDIKHPSKTITGCIESEQFVQMPKQWEIVGSSWPTYVEAPPSATARTKLINNCSRSSKEPTIPAGGFRARRSFRCYVSKQIKSFQKLKQFDRTLQSSCILSINLASSKGS